MKSVLATILPRNDQAIEHFFRVYIASSKHEEGWENSRQLCRSETYSRVFIIFENSPSLQVFKWGYVNTEKALYCFYKINSQKYARTQNVKTVFTYSHLNTAMDQWERA